MSRRNSWRGVSVSQLTAISQQARKTPTNRSSDSRAANHVDGQSDTKPAPPDMLKRVTPNRPKSRGVSPLVARPSSVAAWARSTRLPVKILGIDPGSRLLGFALIEQTGARVTALEYGVLKADGADYLARLADLSLQMAQIIVRLNPQEVAIERAFVHKNPDSALKLGQARGMVMAHCFGLHLPVFEYTPRLVKQSVVGTGAADKAQVQKMVSIILNLTERPSADAADACAVALCHGQARLKVVRS